MIWLQADRGDASARGLCLQHQEDLPDLQGGRSYGQTQKRPQTRAWHAVATAQAGQHQSGLELGFSERCFVGRAAVSCAERAGSMLARMPDVGGGHIHRRCARRAGAEHVDRPLWQAPVHCQ